MFALSLALVVSASSPHLLEGAFGYRLGEAPGAKVASCEDDGIDAGMRMYGCPGDNFFSRIYVHSQRDVVWMLGASRRYKGPDLKKATNDCFSDMQGLKSVLDARYPGLQTAKSFKPNGFRLSERLLSGFAYGRSLEATCADVFDPADKSKRTGVTLWLKYTVSPEESAALDRLDRADKLKSKGLDPDKL